MKTFAITLERAKERKNYIQKHLSELGLDFEVIEGVDGRELTESEIEELCDLGAIKRYPKWLNNGALGCALSHLKVYRKMLEQNLDYAFIVEDDIILPDNIKELIVLSAPKLGEKEVFLFYYSSFKNCLLSEQQGIHLDYENLGFFYPINPLQPITTGAYLIPKSTAESFIKSLLPIRVTSDSWAYFLEEKIINSIRCLYPMTLKTKNFKSSIDYIDPNSFKGKFLEFINEYRIPLFYQAAAWKRRRESIAGNEKFSLTDKKADWL